MNPKQTKILVLSVGTICIGAVGFVGVYLPFHSNLSKSGLEARKKIQQDKQSSASSNSMWDNIKRRD
eukprot:maker-scaffold_12-snap-gene-4.44-mRNA-1 protein AED:0.00 eAED:0.00 QI:53/1/1/1/1/1/2/754/66